MNDIFRGWDYINAIFEYFQKEAKRGLPKSYISPRYIYRGISKRHFTESAKIDEFISHYDESKAQRSYEDMPDYINYEVYEIYKNVIKELHEKNEQSRKVKSEDANQDISQEKEKRTKFYDIMYERLKLEIPKIKVDLDNDNQNEKFSDNTGTSYSSKKEDSNPDNLDNRLSIYLSYLEHLVENRWYKLTQPEQIRSGASVRLRDNHNSYQTPADYINYVKNLISDFKTRNPKYNNYNDLETLAEIQHRGGASCLVDFSNNFLISLWFAVNNDFEDLGYLFCYDVNGDALQKDNITFLIKDRWTWDIEKILRKTRKTTSYSGGEKFRFWFWKPANINGRIARQDSVFVFGIEKFKLTDHGVITLPIPPTWKLPILKALKYFFGLNAESVFPDEDGYAIANSKTSQLGDASEYINQSKITNSGQKKSPFNLELIQSGMACMLKGNYRVALDYFLKSLSLENAKFKILKLPKVGRNYTLSQYEIEIEVNYSIGFAYKKLESCLLAEEYLTKAFVLSYYLLKGERFNQNLDSKGGREEIDMNEEERENILTKFYKITDDFLDVIYQTKNYPLGIKVIDLLTDDFIEDCDIRDFLLCTRNCMSILNYIKLYPSALKDKPGLKLIEVPSSNNSFCKIIDQYLNFIRFALLNPSRILSVKNSIQDNEGYQLYSTLLDLLSNFERNSKPVTNSDWIFTYLSEALRDYFKEDVLTCEFIERTMAKVESLQELLYNNKSIN